MPRRANGTQRATTMTPVPSAAFSADGSFDESKLAKPSDWAALDDFDEDAIIAQMSSRVEETWLAAKEEEWGGGGGRSSVPHHHPMPLYASAIHALPRSPPRHGEQPQSAHGADRSAAAVASSAAIAVCATAASSVRASSARRRSSSFFAFARRVSFKFTQ